MLICWEISIEGTGYCRVIMDLGKGRSLSGIFVKENSRIKRMNSADHPHEGVMN